MGYLHIPQLYRPEGQHVLMFKQLYALEKIHGTSAHIGISKDEFRLFPGGCSMDDFKALFDQQRLPSPSDIEARFKQQLALSKASYFVVFGELYGGKCQGMSKTYGKDLRFVAFDIKVGDRWLSVPEAESTAIALGIPFVPYGIISSDLASIDAERDRPSVQSKRNGIQEDCIREGIVLRPPIECYYKQDRVIAKHKRAEFAERKTIPNVDPAKREIMTNAEKIADEFVTSMRLDHVLDKLGNPTSFSDIPKVIEAMIEDVTREASGEIVDNKIVRKAVGAKTVKLYKAKVMMVI